MTVRPATRDDRPAIIRLGLAFATTLPAFATITEGITAESLGLFLDLLGEMGERAALFVAVDDDGSVIGCMPLCEAPRLFVLTGGHIVEELAWWVTPTRRGLRAGPALLQAAIDWTRTRGLKLLKMGAPAGTRVGVFYEHNGFAAVETAYLKVVV